MSGKQRKNVRAAGFSTFSWK